MGRRMNASEMDNGDTTTTTTTTGTKSSLGRYPSKKRPAIVAAAERIDRISQASVYVSSTPPSTPISTVAMRPPRSSPSRSSPPPPQADNDDDDNDEGQSTSKENNKNGSSSSSNANGAAKANEEEAGMVTPAPSPVLANAFSSSSVAAEGSRPDNGANGGEEEEERTQEKGERGNHDDGDDDGDDNDDGANNPAAKVTSLNSTVILLEHDDDATKDNPNATLLRKDRTQMKTESMTKLRTLRDLYDQGFITQVEYNNRKGQLIDEITGTRTMKTSGRKKPYLDQVSVTHRPPPDFSTIAEEAALKYTYNVKTGKWTHKPVKVKIEPEPFARGGLRKAYHLLDLSEKIQPDVSYVGKMSIDPEEDRDTYYQDAEMQIIASEWAKKFNQCNPPKRVSFVAAWILELVDRPDKPLCAVEIFIAGSYRKHNNNFGYVDDDERNTPQAFSHFTYEASNHNILVCDIQGVGDLYTDPQMHTINGVGFGKGNLGPRGFDKFLSSHRCNAICRYLKLPSINAKVDDLGTVPATPLMSYQRVNVLNFSLPKNSQLNAQLSATTPLLGEDGREKATEPKHSGFLCCAIL